MFFGNKNLEEKVALLEREIEDLKNQLLLKDQEKEEIKSNISKQLEDILLKDEKNIQLFKEIASVSQEEGLVVFDDKNQLFFSNNLAKSNIKDYSVILTAVLENSSRLIMEDCEANIVVKNYENYKIVSLRKTSIHDNKNGGLMDRHNKNMTNSLTSTQKAYLSLLDELQEMAARISQIDASPTMSGVRLARLRHLRICPEPQGNGASIWSFGDARRPSRRLGTAQSAVRPDPLGS